MRVNLEALLGRRGLEPNIVDYIWSRIVTDEQRSRRALFLPTEYSNLHIDESGFISATVSGLTTNRKQTLSDVSIPAVRMSLGGRDFPSSW